MITRKFEKMKQKITCSYNIVSVFTWNVFFFKLNSIDKQMVERMSRNSMSEKLLEIIL